jgi:hypothetical protein
VAENDTPPKNSVSMETDSARTENKQDDREIAIFHGNDERNLGIIKVLFDEPIFGRFIRLRVEKKGWFGYIAMRCGCIIKTARQKKTWMTKHLAGELSYDKLAMYDDAAKVIQSIRAMHLAKADFFRRISEVWTKFFDEDRRKFYYYNDRTMRTQWYVRQSFFWYFIFCSEFCFLPCPSLRCTR